MAKQYQKSEILSWVRSQNSLVIGIGGGSGSGKTTLAQQFQSRLGSALASVISQDAFYFPLFKQPQNESHQVNFDHPDSIEFGLMAHCLNQLRQGSPVEIPRYCFATHERQEEVDPVNPAPLIIVEGLLVLHDPVVRSQLDFKIFVDTEEEVRFERRMKRDTQFRGRSIESVNQQFLSQVKPMHDEYVEPSKRHADVIVSGEKSFEPILSAIENELMVAQMADIHSLSELEH